MRILIAASNRAVIGGAEKYVQGLIPALLRHGHLVSILHEFASVPDQATIDPPDARLPRWLWDDRGRGSALWDQIEEWRPDIVYSQGLLSVDLEKTLLGRFPSVLYAHVYLGTCISGRKCHSFPQVRPCHRRFGPACLALYFPRHCGGWSPIRAWQLYESQARRNSQMSKYRAILVASTHMYREFEQHGVSPDTLELVPLPIPEPAPGMPRSAAGLPRKILFMGRLTDLKGVDHLIQAVPLAEKQLRRRLELTVAGEGPQLEQLQGLARKTGVDVNFAGWLDSERQWDLLRQVDLLAVPSLWPEPFGLVGLEAGRLGVPSAGYAVGGITDWLIPGETGELASGDPPTVPGLAEAIVRALRDPGHHARLSRGALDLSRKFTLERHLASLESVLERASGAAVMARDTAVDLSSRN
jgi:glycosyltransferase involved in cell wall biosynthesis